MGKLLMIGGVALAAVGVLLWALARLGFRGLPGDIRYQGEHVGVYFPIVTCVAVSILLTVALWLWRWLSGH